MGKSISMALRHQIIERHKSGHTLRCLSVEYGVSYTSVQSLIARYKTLGIEGLKPRYERCGRQKRDDQDFVYRAVRCYKTWHPTWGAEKIRTHIRIGRPDCVIPPARTLQKWFSYHNLNKSRDKQPRQVKQWAKSSHEVWQIDAKEELTTLDGEKSCWLNIKDEYTGGVVDPPIFPL